MVLLGILCNCYLPEHELNLQIVKTQTKAQCMSIHLPLLWNSRIKGMLLIWVPTYGNCANKQLEVSTNFHGNAFFSSQRLKLLLFWILKVMLSITNFANRMGAFFKSLEDKVNHSLQSLGTTTLLRAILILSFLHFKQFDVQSKCRSRLRKTHRNWFDQAYIHDPEFQQKFAKLATKVGTMSLRVQ